MHRVNESGVNIPSAERCNGKICIKFDMYITGIDQVSKEKVHVSLRKIKDKELEALEVKDCEVSIEIDRMFLRITTPEVNENILLEVAYKFDNEEQYKYQIPITIRK